jgi:hypothetical protein
MVKLKKIKKDSSYSAEINTLNTNNKDKLQSTRLKLI